MIIILIMFFNYFIYKLKYNVIKKKYNKFHNCNNLLHYPRYVNISKLIYNYSIFNIELCDIIQAYIGNKVYSHCLFFKKCHIQDVLGIDRPEDDFEFKYLQTYIKK